MRSLIVWGLLSGGMVFAVAGTFLSMSATPALDAMDIPEPASMALIGIGLVGVGGLSRLVKTD